MGIQFNKRINLGKGLGINISKSGITLSSYRTKKESLSSKGYSVRTRIPGLTYRKTFSKAKNSGCLLNILLLLSLVFLLLQFMSQMECKIVTTK